jgi:hypothetical protein
LTDEQFYLIHRVGKILALILTGTIVIFIVVTVMNSCVHMNFECKSLLRAIETWQVAFYLNMLNTPLPATATTFAVATMPVINFDLSYTYLGKYLGQWAPTIFA